MRKSTCDFDVGEEYSNGVVAGAARFELDIELFVTVRILSNVSRYQLSVVRDVDYQRSLASSRRVH